MNTQALTQASPTFTGHDSQDAESEAPHDEWTVDDVVRSIRSRDGATHHARRWVAALGALVIAAAATASVGMSADHAATTPKPAALPARIAAASHPRAVSAPVTPPGRLAAAAAAGHGPVSRGQAFVVLMPADRDYMAATSIPVAGMAFGRPHGPRVRVVHVALYVGGRLVAGTDLDVYSGRFAGLLDLEDPIVQADAEIRVSNPAAPSQAAAIRSIRLDAPATTR